MYRACILAWSMFVLGLVSYLVDSGWSFLVFIPYFVWWFAGLSVLYGEGEKEGCRKTIREEIVK